METLENSIKSLEVSSKIESQVDKINESPFKEESKPPKVNDSFESNEGSEESPDSGSGSEDKPDSVDINGESNADNSSSMALDARNPRYKTEMCRNFKERSKCLYGDHCQFAHSQSELRRVVRNTKYKTKLCQKYWISGYCVYGPRCNFLHDELQERNPNQSNTN